MTLQDRVDEGKAVETLTIMLKALEEAKAEKQFLEEQLAQLQDQLKQSRRALKKFIITGLSSEPQTFEVKRFLKGGAKRD